MRFLPQGCQARGNGRVWYQYRDEGWHTRHGIVSRMSPSGVLECWRITNATDDGLALRDREALIVFAPGGFWRPPRYDLARLRGDGGRYGRSERIAVGQKGARVDQVRRLDAGTGAEEFFDDGISCPRSTGVRSRKGRSRFARNSASLARPGVSRAAAPKTMEAGWVVDEAGGKKVPRWSSIVGVRQL